MINQIIQSKHHVYLFFSLLLLSIFASVHPIPWFFGVNLFITPLFLLVMLVLFGTTRALVASVIVYGISLWLGKIDLHLAIIHIGAIAFVGWRLRRNPQGLIVHNIIYWFIIGSPLLAIYFMIFNGNLDNIAIMLMQKEIASSLIYSLIADILISYGYLSRITQTNENFGKGYFFNRMMIHSTLAALIIPYMVYMTASGYKEELNLVESVHSGFTSQAKTVETYLSKLPKKDMFILKQHGFIQTERLSQELRDITKNTSTEILITDPENILLAADSSVPYTAGQVFEWHNGGSVGTSSVGLTYWVPDGDYYSELIRWDHGYLIQEIELPQYKFKIIMMTQFSPLLAKVINTYQSQIWVLLFFSVAILLLSFFFNRVFFLPLSRLVFITNSIPRQLKDGNRIEWNKSEFIEINSLVGNFRTVTDDLMNTFEHTNHLAYFDSLTGLSNRASMQKDLENLFFNSSNKTKIAVLFFDIDRFKQVNDTLGHAVGDQLLKQIAERISTLRHEQCRKYRVSGDEFVVIINNASKDSSEHMAVEILKLLQKPFWIEENELHITSSIGIALYPEHGADVENIMKKADTAMYIAKEKGGNNYVFYNDSFQVLISEQLWMETQLRKALDTGAEEFTLFYQVIMDSKTSTIAGMEALIRWNHPLKGNIPPSEFIPVAEQTGLIIPLGRWVLQQACSQNKKWQDAGYEKVRVAVNLSARQLYSDSFTDEVRIVLEETGLEAKYLELEITEGYIIKNPEYVNNILQDLKDMGVTVAIDDFGTGYSSLAQLKRYPIHTVKIDQTFIRNIKADSNNRAIVRAVIELAHGMNLKVIAEGIETEDERSFIVSQQCDEMQGYFFSKPVPPDKFEALLLSQKDFKQIKRMG